MSKRVLIVDDHKDLCAALAALLGDNPGVEVQVAYDAVAGLAAAKSWKPGLVLLDVMMPGVDGWEACRRLKADPETKDVPVFMMTAVMTKALLQKTAEVGAKRLVIKPFVDRDLAKILEMLDGGPAI